MDILKHLKKLRAKASGSKRKAPAKAVPAKKAKHAGATPLPNVILLRVPKARASAMYETLSQLGYQMLGEAQTGDAHAAKQRRREAKDLEFLSNQLGKHLADADPRTKRR